LTHFHTSPSHLSTFCTDYFISLSALSNFMPILLLLNIITLFPHLPGLSLPQRTLTQSVTLPLPLQPSR
jgi:hypothetical protein